MDFEEYKIVNIKSQNDKIFIFQLIPVKKPNILSFLPGQFVQIKNPSYQKPEEAHLFSIASSPNKDYLEFGIKTYGYWTQAVCSLKVGDSLLIRGPFGKFTWNSSLKNAVFLIGGIGITPIMSMLRFITENQETPTLTLIYCNKTQESIAYKDEILSLSSKVPMFKVINLLSTNKNLDNGYRELVNEEFIKKETNLKIKPTFYLCGSSRFIDTMKIILNNLSIEEIYIKQELF